MEILAFSGMASLNGVRASLSGLGTRSHSRTLFARKSRWKIIPVAPVGNSAESGMSFTYFSTQVLDDFLN
jgi:hypothetical protein